MTLKKYIDIINENDLTDFGATVATGYAGSKIASKMAGKKIPGVGAALYGKDAYDRFNKGDYTGAALQTVGGVASLVPGIGTGIAIGADIASAYLDYIRSDNTKEPEIDPRYNDLPKDADIDIAALQMQLQDLGASITIDGKPSIELANMAKQYKLMD